MPILWHVQYVITLTVCFDFDTYSSETGDTLFIVSLKKYSTAVLAAREQTFLQADASELLENLEEMFLR